GRAAAPLPASPTPDAGSAHARDPAGRPPASHPLAFDFALQTLLGAGAWDTALADGACAWLAAHAPAEGGAVFVDPSIEGWPHAPWWVPEAGGPASLISTALLAGTLHAAAALNGDADAAGRPQHPSPRPAP